MTPRDRTHEFDFNDLECPGHPEGVDWKRAIGGLVFFSVLGLSGYCEWLFLVWLWS